MALPTKSIAKTIAASLSLILVATLAAQTPAPAYDFSAASAAINTAISEKKLPGAVLLVGHNGQVVFEQAYGVRKYAGEPGALPGPDGKPSLAPEPMTLDTIFDMASLTKCLATATAIMQLVEQGKVDVDAPVIRYLPEFAATPTAKSAPPGANSPTTTTPTSATAPNANPATTPDTNSPAPPNASTTTTPSAKGATTYQPGPKAQVQAQNELRRAEGPTYNKATVTVRELLTHYSGLPPDVDLKDPWGLAAPDKAEGMKRAMQSKLVSTPGTHFEYSDINYITLGAIVERLSGETLDAYVQRHIFTPLSMTHTRYLPIADACGDSRFIPPYSLDPKRAGKNGVLVECMSPPGQQLGWDAATLVPYIAPTQHDDQGTAETNPDFDHLLRGTVHDPTTRRMGGVAGQAGVFSTAEDVSKYAQALLDKLLHNTGPFPLKQSTLRLMTTPEQPPTAENTATTFTAAGEPTKGVALRGFGWDINSAYSRPRGSIFPTDVSPSDKTVPSFGHTGFTGTSLWIDPSSDTYVILLANSVHPRGAAPVSPLRGEVATAVAKALGVGTAITEVPLPPGVSICDVAALSSCPTPNAVIPSGAPERAAGESNGAESRDPRISSTAPPTPVSLKGTASAVPLAHPVERAALAAEVTAPRTPTLEPRTSNLEPVLTGLDVLESTHFAALKSLAAQHNNHLRIGLLTNQTGLDSHGHRTIDILRNADPSIELVRLFSPEHGIFGAKDSTNIGQETDPTTGLKVTSLYGPKDSDKRPKPEDLADLDAVVIDLQDAGVRFYTYETVVGYFLEAAACEAARAHNLAIIVLDRPPLTGGLAVQGPVSDTAPSYINYMPEPVRNGMTLGELAQYMRSEHPGGCVTSAVTTKVSLNDTASDSANAGNVLLKGTASAVPLQPTKNDAALAAEGSLSSGPATAQVTQGFSLGPQAAPKNSGALAPGISAAPLPQNLIGRDFSPGNTASLVNVGFSPRDMPPSAQPSGISRGLPEPSSGGNSGLQASPSGGSSGLQASSSGGSRGLQAPESSAKNRGALAPGVSPSPATTQVTQGFSLGPQAAGALAPRASPAPRASLTVVPLQNWHRDEFFDQTGALWINPSPNLRNIQAATLYPGLGMLDFANISVGRGTNTPFELFGAGATPATKDVPASPAWFDGPTVASYLTARHIPGVTFAPTTFAVADDANHYPYHGQTIQGVRLTVTDRLALDSPELGIEILSALHHLYPAQFKLEKATNLVANTEAMAALAHGDDPRAIAATWAPALDAFRARRANYLIYR